MNLNSINADKNLYVANTSAGKNAEVYERSIKKVCKTVPITNRKAAEAEDIKRRHVFPFSANKLTLAGLKREAESILSYRQQIEQLSDGRLAIRNSHMWDCTKRIPQKEGGNVFEYTLKQEFFDEDKHIEMSNEINPAFEPFWADILATLTSNPWLGELGFDCEVRTDCQRGICFYAPDAEALTNLWEKFRRKRPELPELNITVSNGIATDHGYAMATIVYDILLSIGKESIHDDYFHCIPTLINFFASVDRDRNNFPKQVCQNHRVLLAYYRRLEFGQRLLAGAKLAIAPEVKEILRTHFDKMKMEFGCFADILSSEANFLVVNNIEALKDVHDDIWTGKRLSCLVKNRFNISDKKELEAILPIWKTLKDVELLFDQKQISNSTLQN